MSYVIRLRSNPEVVLGVSKITAQLRGYSLDTHDASNVKHYESRILATLAVSAYCNFIPANLLEIVEYKECQ